MVFYVYKDRLGEWRWYLKSSNGRKIATSGEGYYSKQGCLAAVALVQGSSRAMVCTL